VYTQPRSIKIPDTVVRRLRMASAGKSDGQPTMADVARRAGVAPKTVSRVINGEAWVSPTTAATVRRAIAELGYTPNASARSLKRGSSHTVGLVLEDVAEPFQAVLTRAVEEEISTQGRLLFTASSLFSVERERALVNELAARQVDGLIVVPTSNDHAHLAKLAQSGLPVVFADRPPQGFDADAVMADNYAGAYAGVQHLVDQGHERIAFVAGRQETFTGKERLRAYRDCLTDNHLDSPDHFVLVGAARQTGWDDQFADLLARIDRPTAIFSASSTVSAALLRKFEDAIAPLAVVGFDDLPFADLLRRPLTVVAQDPIAIGRNAAQLLTRRIGGQSQDVQRIQISCRLIEREAAPRALPDAAIEQAGQTA
jgi:LacI family transcriptional regulator